MEVPDIVSYAFPGKVLRMDEPGALRSTDIGPKLEVPDS
jgi:hypothetical protein